MADGVMVLRGELTTTTFLNYHTFLLNSKYLLFISTDSVALTPHQRNFSAAEAITANHNWSKGRGQLTLGCLTLTDKSITQLPLSRLTEHHERGCRKTVGGRRAGCPLQGSVFHIRHRNHEI